MRWFRGGLVFKAHRRLYHNSRLESNKEEEKSCVTNGPTGVIRHQGHGVSVLSRHTKDTGCPFWRAMAIPRPSLMGSSAPGLHVPEGGFGRSGTVDTFLTRIRSWYPTGQWYPTGLTNQVLSFFWVCNVGYACPELLLAKPFDTMMGLVEAELGPWCVCASTILFGLT